MDPETESKIRAMALARRRLAREIRRLKGGSDDRTPLPQASTEMDRLVLLSRSIFDSSSDSTGLRPEATEPRANARDSAVAGPEHDDPAPSGLAPCPSYEQPPTPEHKLVLQGQAGWFLTPDLIGCLGSVRKSGILKIQTVSEVFTIEFHAGDIVHCESTRPSAGQRLGDILVSQGALDRATLEEHLEAPSTERLGTRLLKEGIITQHQLDSALKAQIQVLFCHLGREKSKGFTFWAGPSLFAASGIRMSVISLLLEGARVNDEFADGLQWLEDRYVQESTES